MRSMHIRVSFSSWYMFSRAINLQAVEVLEHSGRVQEAMQNSVISIVSEYVTVATGASSTFDSHWRAVVSLHPCLFAQNNIRGRSASEIMDKLRWAHLGQTFKRFWALKRELRKCQNILVFVELCNHASRPGTNYFFEQIQ